MTTTYKDPTMDKVEDILQRNTAISSRMTPTGTKIAIIKADNCSLYKVGTDKGSLPDALRGQMFTSVQKASEKIDQVLEKLWDKSDKASKRNGTS